MSYSVGRIPGNMVIDPEAGGQGQQRKRERPAQRAGGADSVSISEEARRRSAEEPSGETGDSD
jgi:hypothetical protein